MAGHWYRAGRGEKNKSNTGGSQRAIKISRGEELQIWAAAWENLLSTYAKTKAQNCAADQRLRFHYTAQSLFFLNHIAIFWDCTALFVSDLFWNPGERFSRDAAQIWHRSSLMKDQNKRFTRQQPVFLDWNLYEGTRTSTLLQKLSWWGRLSYPASYMHKKGRPWTRKKNPGS